MFEGKVQTNSGELNKFQPWLGYSETLLLGLNWISSWWSPVCNLWEEMGGSSGWVDLGKSPRFWNSTGMFCWIWALQQGSISESPPSAYPLHRSHSPVKRKYILMSNCACTKWFVIDGMDDLTQILCQNLPISKPILYPRWLPMYFHKNANATLAFGIVFSCS